MQDLAQAAETVASFMRMLTTVGGFRLRYRITAGAGAQDPDNVERRDIYVECKGPDSELLLDNEGELLRALEHIAAKMLNLEPEDHDRVSFDALGFKAERATALRVAAEKAAQSVETSGRPYSFPPMNSRERRILHLFLRDTGLQTASSGEGARRFVVVYPADARIPAETASRPQRRGFGGGYGRGRGGGGGSDRGGRRY